MKPHRKNYRPDQRVGFGWAIVGLLGVALAVVALLTRCADLF